MTRAARSHPPGVLVLGVGAFAHSSAQILKDAGAAVCTYLTRDYAHFPPSLAGPVFRREQCPSPAPLIEQQHVEVVLPMSIDWAQAAWGNELLATKVPIFCPQGEGMRIERERDFARALCQQYKIPFPRSHVARNRLEAEALLAKHARPFVIKNPLCAPNSPVHTICCETVEDTRAWLRQINYAEGVFLQEYLGRREAGHIAFVSAGEVHSVVTNQEYKRAYAGDMGIVAGAPLGGLAEKDPDDRYGLARELLQPLRPWFRRVKYYGPIQVTAVHDGRKWQVVEYNIRIGVTSGAMLLRMLKDPLGAVMRTSRNEKLDLAFVPGRNFGCSVTLAGHGYPFTQVRGPVLPVEVSGELDCDVWWNEVARDGEGRLQSTGHRIADVIGIGKDLSEAAGQAYSNIRKIRSLGSYYRPDIGQSLWPPGTA
jgi:phosphoribosylamine---glycine ligase